VAILDEPVTRTPVDAVPVPRRWWGTLRVAVLVALPAAAGAAAYLSRIELPWMVVSLYGIVSISRVLVQSFAAVAMRRRQAEVTDEPMVSIVVAVLNETPTLFAAAMRSLAAQRWARFEVIVIDDGSADPAPFEAVCRELGFRYAYQPNAGKRHALHHGFGLMHPESEYVLTSDSDTVWDPETIRRLVATMHADGRVGAVTGHVDTLNPRDSWLTQLIARRYWLAFEVERAAQGFFGAVTCVSGPLGGYRRDLIDQIRDRFVNQVFLGRVCTFGDDRHLTNLVLGLGYRVAYCRAQAWTEVPTRLRPYLRQQLRWNRSFWRESLWTVRALPLHGPWLTIDCLLTVLLPFQLAVTVCWFGWMAATVHAGYLLVFLATVVAMSLLRLAPAIIATRRADFLILIVFGLFHLAVILPLRFVALVTVAGGGWGSRQSHPTPAAGSVEAAEGGAQAAYIPAPTFEGRGERQQEHAAHAQRHPAGQPLAEQHQLVHRDDREHQPAEQHGRLQAPHRSRHHHGERGAAEHQPPHGIALGRQDRREAGQERGGERRPVGLPTSQHRPRTSGDPAGDQRHRGERKGVRLDHGDRP
jgi:hyaluronan synthase